MIQTFWNVLAALPAPGGGLDESHPVVPLALASLARPLQARAGGLAGGLTRLCDIGGGGRHQERCLSQLRLRILEAREVSEDASHYSGIAGLAIVEVVDQRPQQM